MRNIVVGIDGSEPSVSALLFAASLAEDLPEAQLVVAHARYVPYLWSPKHVAEAEFSDLLDEAEHYVRNTAQGELGGRDLEWTIDVREGEPSQVLREIARDADASFVVVGRRGWSIAEELLLGSVSNRLVHRAEVPLLLVR
jgi:nucleotide-binding universal stress UspA family protein